MDFAYTAVLVGAGIFAYLFQGQLPGMVILFCPCRMAHWLDIRLQKSQA